VTVGALCFRHLLEVQRALHASGVTCRNERSHPAIDAPANVAPKPEAPDGGRRMDGRTYANSETAEDVRRQVAQ